MINIRPVSDLRNKFPEIEEQVFITGAPVFLTKNGYGSMVIMSLEQYSALTDGIDISSHSEQTNASKSSKTERMKPNGRTELLPKRN